MMPRVLVVGAGGLGCPVVRILLERGDVCLRVVDDDIVELSNLHRQVLYREGDVGRAKVDVLSTHPLARGLVEGVAGRLTPSNAAALMQDCAVVVEGTDSFAAKFAACDAARMARVPIVHAACVRWHGTVLAVPKGGAPCYRCLFEDVPDGDAPNCSEAGILGPVAGVIGAVAASAAMQLLADGCIEQPLWTFDGRSATLRQRALKRRTTCMHCAPLVSP
jgi:molybdopterin/thiamine biosynthesis adenylyltransferase